MTKPGKQPAKKNAAEGDAPKATIDKGSHLGRKDVEELFAAMSQNLASGKTGTGGATKSKPRTELEYTIDWTVHASTGQKGKNRILKFKIFAWEKDQLKGITTGCVPCEAIWYDKNNKINLAKVPTPEVAGIIIEMVKAACPESAAKMTGEISARATMHRRSPSPWSTPSPSTARRRRSRSCS